MYPRLCHLPENNSFFLFGARGTGKSTLLRQSQFLTGADTLWIDLLDPATLERYALTPAFLSEQLKARPETRWVVIDEVQRLPELLNLAHWHIEDSKRRGQPIYFALTGSSARKLKRGQANLLAGRAWLRHLHPLTRDELGADFRLEDVLAWGSLPAVLALTDASARTEQLRAYCAVFIAEEIVAEQLVRNLQPFRRFLQVAAQSNGKIINASKIGRDAGADYKTVQGYFEILEDTMIGYLLHPFHSSFRKRLSQKPKFYYFDPGVARAFSGTLDSPLTHETFAFGNAFEHWVILEAVRTAAYRKVDARFSYIRTKDDAEVDLVVERGGRPICLIEIKSTTRVARDDVAAVSTLVKDLSGSVAYCLSRDAAAREIDGVRCLDWERGLDEILAP